MFYGCGFRVHVRFRVQGVGFPGCETISPKPWTLSQISRFITFCFGAHIAAAEDRLPTGDLNNHAVFVQ